MLTIRQHFVLVKTRYLQQPTPSPFIGRRGRGRYIKIILCPFWTEIRADFLGNLICHNKHIYIIRLTLINVQLIKTHA